jgi:Tfp pilus assembly protein PilV
MTLVEVVIAMALITMVIGGLYAVGLKSIRFTEHNRLATEARGMAKERLEDIIAVGMANLANTSCTLTNRSTNLTSRGDVVVRQPRVAWHAADGSVTNLSAAVYAEAHVDVSFRSQLSIGIVTDTYSSIVVQP